MAIVARLYHAVCCVDLKSGVHTCRAVMAPHSIATDAASMVLCTPGMNGGVNTKGQYAVRCGQAYLIFDSVPDKRRRIFDRCDPINTTVTRVENRRVCNE
jgi:hypothetical protein